MGLCLPCPDEVICGEIEASIELSREGGKAKWSELFRGSDGVGEDPTIGRQEDELTLDPACSADLQSQPRFRSTVNYLGHL